MVYTKKSHTQNSTIEKIENFFLKKNHRRNLTAAQSESNTDNTSILISEKP